MKEEMAFLIEFVMGNAFDINEQKWDQWMDEQFDFGDDTKWIESKIKQFGYDDKFEAVNKKIWRVDDVHLYTSKELIEML